MNLQETFDKFNDDYIKFERIVDPLCECPDICAFLLLNKLIPQKGDIISGADHDEIFLRVSCEKLAEVATEEDILYLVRCGVRYNTEYNCLSMFI